MHKNLKTSHKRDQLKRFLNKVLKCHGTLCCLSESQASCMYIMRLCALF